MLVSHDRHLLRATTDQFWLVHDGRVAPFDGDLDDYSALVLASRREATETASDGSASRRDARRQEAQARIRKSSARKPVQNRITQTESELARVSSEVRELDALLAAPDFYHSGDQDKVAAILKQRGELAGRVDELEARWLQLTAELEAMD